jgi:DNA-binding response OmpR family regulator
MMSGVVQGAACILIVDDDPSVLELLKELVTAVGFKTLTAGSGEAGVMLAETEAPDLVLLDVNLPGIDGFEACRRIKSSERCKGMPVILLTTMGDVDSRVKGLELGADDYLGKPFNAAELSARIHLCLRRAPQDAVEKLLELGNLKINRRSMDVDVAGARVELTPREYEILVYLLSHLDEAVERKKLMEALWPGTSVGSRTVDTHVTHLRKKLAAFTHSIETIHGIGFILRSSVA